jgi:type 1 glutamine amidotransferase
MLRKRCAIGDNLSKDFETDYPMRLLNIGFFASFALAVASNGAEPLRVYIESGAKTHGPGMHEHPKFLAEWTKLLNDRGAHCEGGASFPSAEVLDRTDVLLIYTGDGGDLNPSQREDLDHFLRRGGGLICVLDGVCGHDPQRWKTVTGVAWEYGHTKWKYTKFNLRFRDHTHPITAGAADVALDDEVYDGLHVIDEAHVLAEAEFLPKDPAAGDPVRSIPQVWTLEKDGYRAFTSIPGLRLTTFSVPAYRALLLRGIAWAGHRENVEEFCTSEESAALKQPSPAGP